MINEWKSCDEVWDMYQLGQVSLDHTDKQVFCEIYQQLLDDIDELKEKQKECICLTNWRDIVKEYEPLIGKKFIYTKTNEVCTFFGIVWSDDDFYYGLYTEDRKTNLFSCVGHLSDWGFELKEEYDNE